MVNILIICHNNGDKTVNHTYEIARIKGDDC